MPDTDVHGRRAPHLARDGEEADLVLTGLGRCGVPVPADAAYAVEARPYRHAAPLVFLFVAEAEALLFAERIAGWPGPRPLVGRILPQAEARGAARAVTVGEGSSTLTVEEIDQVDGRPW